MQAPRLWTNTAATSRAGQLQLASTDGGVTWTKKRTNITDVSASTPSLILDAERGLVHCYYFERGPGLLKHRTARVADILADPAASPLPFPAQHAIIDWHT